MTLIFRMNDDIWRSTSFKDVKRQELCNTYICKLWHANILGKGELCSSKISHTKSETSSSTLQVQFKEIPNEDVGQDETLSEVIAVLETNDYNSNIENIVEEVYTAVNM